MKTLLVATTVAAAFLAGGPVAAGDVYADAGLFATIESIDVIVEDDVTDRCLFNAKGIEARLLATLERSGIFLFPTLVPGRSMRTSSVVQLGMEIGATVV